MATAYRVTVQRVVTQELVETHSARSVEWAEDFTILNACELHGGSPTDWEIVRTEVLDETPSTP